MTTLSSKVDQQLQIKLLINEGVQILEIAKKLRIKPEEVTSAAYHLRLKSAVDKQVTQLVEDGLHKTAIGKAIGISRDRVRTIVKRLGLEDKVSIGINLIDIDIEAVVQRLKNNESCDTIARSIGVGEERLKKELINAGIDYKAIVKEAYETKFNGLTFGSWVVIGRSEAKPTEDLKCQCVCGTIKDVTKSNLYRGVSRSCGCGVTEYETYPWINQTTKERINTTSELASKLNVSNMTLYSKAHKHLNYVDSNGHVWECLYAEKEVGIQHLNSRNRTKWENQTTKEVVFGLDALAKKLQIPRSGKLIVNSRKTKRIEKDGQVWIRLN